MSLQSFPSFFLNFSEQEMHSKPRGSYQFKSFRLHLEERQLLQNEIPIALTPKAFDVLSALVERAGHLVDKEELLKVVWADSFVEEANVARIVHTLRKVLGEDNNGSKFIETVAKKGYRFVAEVTEVREAEELEHTNGNGKGIVANIGNGDPEPRILETVHAGDLAVPNQTSPEPAVQPRRGTRIILFAVGFLTAAFLLVLLSFNSRSDSVNSSNKILSIAVLPLKPLTPDNRDPIYELGVADSLILKLSLAKDLVVRQLSATRRYADIEQDPVAAGREQKVDYVLESNYQIADGIIRITSQLINVQSGQVEEVFKHDQPNSGSFAVQDAVVANIGQSLLKKLNREPNDHLIKLSTTLPKRYTTDEAAYRLYLLGSALADKREPAEVRKAISYLEQAVALDPNYALAYARLANAQTAVVGNRSGGADEQYPKAKAAVEKALAIDDDLSEAHSYLGEIKANFEGDFAGAEREHKRAVELDNNSPIAHRMYSLLLTYLGRHDESLAEIKTAIDLEPASTLNQLMFGRSLLFARRYDEAITVLERTAEMGPESFLAHQSLTVAYRLKGDNDRAFESFVKTRILSGEEPADIDLWKSVYARSGWQGVLTRQLEQARANEEKGKPNYNLMANLSSELEHRAEAFAYLEKALVQHGTITMLRVHPRFDSLRDDPRFDELLRRVGF